MRKQALSRVSNQSDVAVWRKLLSGSRLRIAQAVAEITAAGLTDEYADRLLKARRRHARCERHWLWLINFNTPYTERERRSALLALTALWGVLGRELAMALDPKASHFDREPAHKALVRRHDQRAVKVLINALLDDSALEDWQCISTLGSLGDAQAADGLMAYLGMDSTVDRPVSRILEFGIEVGHALRMLNSPNALTHIETALNGSLARQRTGAALALGGWGEERLAVLLSPLFEDDNPQVRLAAVMAAGELKASESATPLRSALSDPDSQVRAAAEGALQQVLASTAKRSIRTSRMQPIGIGQR